MVITVAIQLHYVVHAPCQARTESLCIFSYLMLPPSHKVYAIMIVILQMRNLSLREVKDLAEGHSAARSYSNRATIQNQAVWLQSRPGNPHAMIR